MGRFRPLTGERPAKEGVAMSAKNDAIGARRSSVARDGAAPRRPRRAARSVDRPMTDPETRRAEDEADIKIALAARGGPFTATLEEVMAKMGL